MANAKFSLPLQVNVCPLEFLTRSTSELQSQLFGLEEVLVLIQVWRTIPPPDGGLEAPLLPLG